MSVQGNGQLSPLIKAGWAAGDVGIACFVGGTMSFLLFFLTQAHGVSPWWAGVALLIPRLLDMVADPLMGAISDRTTTSMGRRRPYLLYGSIAFAVTFYLTFHLPELDDTLLTVTYASFIYLLASLAYTMYAIPHAAMVAEMSSSYRERTSIVGYRMMGARLGIVTVSLGGPLLFGSQESLKEGFQLFAAVFAVVIVVGGFISFRATRNAPYTESHEASFSLRDEILALWRNQPLRVLSLAFLLQNVAIGASATSIVYFLTFSMNVQVSHVGWFTSGAAFVAMLATPLWVLAGKRWGVGKRRLYASAMLIEIIGFAAVALFIAPGSLAFFMVLLVLLGIGDAGCQLAPHSMVPDTVEADELQTGARREGVIFGALSACLKLGMALGAFLASATLSLAGFAPGEAIRVQEPEALTGVRIAYCVVPILLWSAALWTLRRYELDEASHDSMRRQLAEAGARSGSSRRLPEPEDLTGGKAILTDREVRKRTVL